MKNGTSVLELTMPTRTVCAVAGPASTPSETAKVASTMTRVAMRM
jgi:hypothetical protein